MAYSVMYLCLCVTLEAKKLSRIGWTKVKSPSDWVNQSDVTFRLGQSRWRHLQIRSIKVTSPSDWVNQGDITFRLNQSRWCHLPIFLPYPWSFLSLAFLPSFSWPSFLPSLIGLVWLNTLCIIRCYWQKALKTTLCECRDYFVKAPMAYSGYSFWHWLFLMLLTSFQSCSSWCDTVEIITPERLEWQKLYIVKPESKSPIPCPNRPQILTLRSDQV